LINQKL